MLKMYSDLLAPRAASRVCEKKHPYILLTERHIQAAWLEQKYFKHLKTADGIPIEVLSPGIWNLEAGPDFRKAHLKIGDKIYFGDIEIDMAVEGWQQHGHYVDSRYNNVILHVAFWQPHKISSIQTLSGQGVLQVYLENFLTIAPMRLIQLIDVELYPYKKFLGSGRCAKELFQHLQNEEILQLFRAAAHWRLHQKRMFFRARIGSSDNFVSAGIAMALGYKHNAELFLDLRLALRKQAWHSQEHAMAWLMAKCGFFTNKFTAKWGESLRYQQLARLVKECQLAPEPILPIALHQIRPYNHPIRRMAMLVKMTFDPALKNLHSEIFNNWQSNWSQCHQKQRWKPLLVAFRELLPSYQDEYWNSHYLFECDAKPDYIALMGEDLKREIVVNIFLPLLEEHVMANAQEAETAAFRAFYASLAASNSGKTTYLTHRFFGDTAKGKLLNHADIEQGAFQLHYDFCVHFESSCEGCPFVERYRATKP